MWDKYTATYAKTLSARHLDPDTIKGHLRSLDEFATQLGGEDPREASLNDLLNWRVKLAKRALAISTQNAKLRQVKAFYRWLFDSDRALVDPGKKLPVLRTPRALPKGVPSAAQVVKLLHVPNITTPVGVRDRAMFELLYSSGLRVGELCALSVYDLDFDTRTVRIVQGKGRKDRAVPVGRAALDWCGRYFTEVRQALLTRRKNNYGKSFFLNLHGGMLTGTMLYRIVKRCAKVAGLAASTTTHALRHACATEMLRGGASVRHVQEMLGHASITTTQIYTHLVKSDLLAVHSKTAPSEQRKDKEAPVFELGNWRPRKRKKMREKTTRKR